MFQVICKVLDVRLGYSFHGWKTREIPTTFMLRSNLSSTISSLEFDCEVVLVFLSNLTLSHCLAYNLSFRRLIEVNPKPEVL